MLNETTEIRGLRGEIGGAYVSEATVLWLRVMVALSAGDTVEQIRSSSAYDWNQKTSVEEEVPHVAAGLRNQKAALARGAVCGAVSAGRKRPGGRFGGDWFEFV